MASKIISRRFWEHPYIHTTYSSVACPEVNKLITVIVNGVQRHTLIVIKQPVTPPYKGCTPLFRGSVHGPDTDALDHMIWMHNARREMFWPRYLNICNNRIFVEGMLDLFWQVGWNGRGTRMLLGLFNVCSCFKGIWPRIEDAPERPELVSDHSIINQTDPFTELWSGHPGSGPRFAY